MKITKAQLKQIIMEELSTLKEGDRTPDDVEVQIEGCVSGRKESCKLIRMLCDN